MYDNLHISYQNTWFHVARVLLSAGSIHDIQVFFNYLRII